MVWISKRKVLVYTEQFINAVGRHYLTDSVSLDEQERVLRKLMQV